MSTQVLKFNYMLIPGLVNNTKPEMIKTAVEQFTGVNIDLPTRQRQVVEARQIAMTIIKAKTRTSLAKIGMLCGGKDHATVLHAEKTVNNLLATNKEYKAFYAPLFEMYEYKMPQL